MSMSKLLQSFSSSSARYSRGLEVSRVTRRRGYLRLGPVGSYESTTASPSFLVRVPKRLRILRLATYIGKKPQQLRGAGQPTKEHSSTLWGRVRLAYERMMLKAASKGGELTAIPVAKASRAPPTLALAFGSRHGTKLSDLDAGFKMTAMEKNYLEHLKRFAASGRS